MILWTTYCSNFFVFYATGNWGILYASLEKIEYHVHLKDLNLSESCASNFIQNNGGIEKFVTK